MLWASEEKKKTHYIYTTKGDLFNSFLSDNLPDPKEN